jgi:DNA-binding response OmpR family regulator
MPFRVLIVEDEKKIATHLQNALEKEGFQTEVAHTGPAALVRITSDPFNVVVLDIMLPGLDGLSILKQIRAAGITTPVLALSARGDVGERIEGLNAGADDYLPKPFVLAEVVARVRALLRRKQEPKAGVLEIGDLTLDPNRRTAKRGSRHIDLATREFKLLEFLMRSAGQVCSRAAIIKNVWEYNFDPGTNLVDVYIMRIREKIEEGSERKLLHTIRGVGYVLKDEE